MVDRSPGAAIRTQSQRFVYVIMSQYQSPPNDDVVLIPVFWNMPIVLAEGTLSNVDPSTASDA